MRLQNSLSNQRINKKSTPILVWKLI